ncbi:putative membrane protein YfcA [Peptoniphilus ivorii]|uniref:sulfite exporter TauE/SafE family protein n=1 Tax=Aedoeadaptatus ivorii TaxID=54006 RepID=UPI0027847678|nr:sulfite exporter TauE/SafE family protein [Peptoniphilus ivorii]MDQ0507997.1 putative membrane protein YfcA [Peptoniphilus ivorii]
MIVTLLLGVLTALTLYFLFFLVKDLTANKEIMAQEKASWVKSGLIGAFVNFFDTLGIGSFAPLTALLDFFKQLDHDKLLPGTLNVSCTIPVLTEAFIFIQSVEVDPITLFAMVAAAVVGSFVGSRTVSKLPEKKVQFYMGIALLVTAALMLLKQFGVLDMLGTGNQAVGLTGIKLVIGVVVNFFLGALMTIGVGLYAPCMALVYMLGLNPLVAFPIMMASCAGLMPVASAEFVKAGVYARKASIAITIGGMIGVFIAAKFVTGLPMNILTVIITIVVIYTAITYIRKSKRQVA